MNDPDGVDILQPFEELVKKVLLLLVLQSLLPDQPMQILLHVVSDYVELTYLRQTYGPQYVMNRQYLILNC